LYSGIAYATFTLIEILIVVVILGILAAIVIPQFTDASEEAQQASVRSQLQTIRGQIELFRVQMPAVAATWDPTAAAAGAEWNALVDNDYLQAPPVNPLTDSSAVAGAGGAAVGWIWRQKTGASTTMNIYASDPASADGDNEFDE
jgi:general secretion pathway protein G